jgi:two-component system phosphate regulon sensor histidine kinase PhoR
MKRSIGWRFAVPFALFLVLTIAGLSLYLFNAFSQVYRSSIHTGLSEEANLIIQTVRPLLESGANPASLETQARSYAATLHVRVTIIRADGVVLADSDADPAGMENHSSRPEVIRALQGQDNYDVRYSATLRTNLLYTAVPVQSGDKIIAVVRLARPLAGIESSLNGIRTSVTGAALILTALAFLIAVLISDYTVRPIVQLTETALRYSRASGTPATLPDSSNEIERMSSAFDQMAAQIQAQIEALQSEQQKMSSVLERMMDGVIVIDAEGKVQLINPAAERMFQVNAVDVLGRSPIQAFGVYQIVDLWKKTASTGVQQAASIDVQPNHVYLQAIAAPLEENRPGGTLMLFQDLTNQRRLETIRQDFVSNVSHELRTPLASLKALTETLQEGALEDPPAARRFLERMEIEIDTLTQMVRELLELSRIESGRVPVKLRPVFPRDLLTPPFERMRVQAERAGLSMSLHCPDDLPAVSADAERMEQVIVNLLHNAIKFTPPDGKIDVSVTPEDGRLIFQVRDTGVGIASKDLPRIFERFYKADRARSGGGTGLGLSIARHIVEAHNGRIWAESAPGKGSTFSFSLPLATANPGPSSPQS